jgi:broad specificity phosphatase PhoE
VVKIFLVRHGKPNNPRHIIYGRLPGFPLTEYGQEEVRLAGEYIKDRLVGNPEVIFSSPLLRTKQTVQILSQIFPKAKVIFDKNIQELDLGWWVGKSEEELVRQGIWQVYLESPSSLENGETFAGAQERIVSWFKKVVVGRKGKEIIVVTHKDLIRLLTLFLEKRPIDDLNKILCNTGSVTTVEVNQMLKLVKPILYWEPDGLED